MNRIPPALSAVILASSVVCATETGLVFEGENLRITGKSGNPHPQDLKPWGAGAWSGDTHLWWTGAKPGGVLELVIPVEKGGRYRLAAGFTKAVDYGIFDIALDGHPLATLDFYNDGVVHTGPVPLGAAMALAAGDRRLTLTVKGANPLAVKSYMLGLDYILLAPEEGALADFAPKLAAAHPPKPRDNPAAGLKEGNTEGALPKSAGEQQRLFKAPEGFVVELVASEEHGLPKPAMAAFDHAGRLWSATATAYPCDDDPATWTEPGPDRVVVIDNPTAPSPQPVRVFSEGMVMPLSVLPSGNGAYIAQGPEILFIEDTDGDGRADSRKVLLKGFGVQDTHTLPHQLTRMPGNRIVYSQGVLNNGKVTDAGGSTLEFNKTLVASFRPDGTGHEIISAGLNNIWSWAVSRTGQVFITEANDLGYSIVPFEEDSTYPSFFNTKIHPDAPMHPPTAEGLNLGGTGFSGLALSDDRAGSFPAPYQGMLFVANPITGRINAVTPAQAPDGVWKFIKQPDLLSCDDPMFRPVAVTFGPDGCLYITDWYNRIISHNEVARDHPARDKAHGRIWRLKHRSQQPRRIPDLSKLSHRELVSRLSADSAWEARTASQLLGRRPGDELLTILRPVVLGSDSKDDTKLHALWALEDAGMFDREIWTSLLANTNPFVRREAVRAMSSLRVPAAEGFALLQPLSEEKAWTVRYEILRFFRRTAGDNDPAHIAWLSKWSATPAETKQVNGWNGPFLALGGSYERAFQDFLLRLVQEKHMRPVVAGDSPFDGVISTEPARPAEEIAAIAKRVAEIRKLMESPDRQPDTGKQFVRSMCTMCHRMGDKGVSLAPPLDGSASRDIDGLITAIVDPDAAVENVFRLYRIETKDGAKLEGFKKSGDAKEIVLMFMGGTTQSVPVAQIERAGYVQDKSFMPSLGAGMSDAQVADVVLYLRTIK